MVANHPILLPPFVPYVFNVQLSNPKQKMSSLSRSLTPTTEDQPLATTASTSNSALIEPAPTPQFTPKYIILINRALFDGNPSVVTKMLLKTYYINPITTSSALATLATGSKMDRIVLTRIFDSLFDSNPISAVKILQLLYNGYPFDDSSSASAFTSWS